jgi:uncharacterized membrane protein
MTMVKLIAAIVLTAAVTVVVVGLLVGTTDWLEAGLGAALIAAAAIAGVLFNRRYKDAPPLFGRRPDAH